MKIHKNITILDKLLIFSSLLLFLVIFIVIISKKNVRGIESNVVYTIERVMSDNNALYENVRETPYSVTQYSPLYYMISDFSLTVLNISTENNSYLIRVFLRVQNLAFFALIIFTAINLIELLRDIRLTKREQLLFALLFTSLTVHWQVITRPDVLVSLSFVSSIYFLTIGIKRNKILSVFIAGFISLLAFLSKQNGLLLLLFTGSFLLFQLRFKSFSFYTLGIIFSGLLFVVLYYSCNYPIDWIKINLVEGIDNGIDLYSAINHAIVPFTATFGFPLLIIVAIVFQKRKIIKMDFGLLYVSIFSFICLGFSLLTSLKIGSAENYFNDFILLAIILLFALIRDKISEKVMLVGVLFSIALGAYQLFKYSPRSLYFTFSNHHYKELSYSRPFVENLDKGKFFYTNIRNLALDYPNHCIFPQYEIFSSAIQNEISNSIYQEILNNVNYDQLDLMIIDTKQHSLPLDLTNYKLTNEYQSIKVYEKLNTTWVIVAQAPNQ